MAVRTERKSLDIAITKMPRKQGGGWNIQAILAIQVRNKYTQHTTRHSGAPFPLILYIVFSINHKDTLIQCHSFINPYKLIRKRAEFNKDFSWLILKTTLCKTQISTTLPFGDRKVGSESSGTITSTTKSSVSSLNAGESWSNFDTLVTAAVSCLHIWLRIREYLTKWIFILESPVSKENWWKDKSRAVFNWLTKNRLILKYSFINYFCKHSSCIGSRRQHLLSIFFYLPE